MKKENGNYEEVLLVKIISRCLWKALFWTSFGAMEHDIRLRNSAQ